MGVSPVHTSISLGAFQCLPGEKKMLGGKFALFQFEPVVNCSLGEAFFYHGESWSWGGGPRRQWFPDVSGMYSPEEQASDKVQYAHSVSV